MNEDAGSAAVLYRTRIGHIRRAPLRDEFRHRSYSWYVDLDELPRLPVWLRPFADFRADDHFPDDPAGPPTLRGRVDAFLAGHGIALTGGRVTALLHARVLGHGFNPLSVFWCHDADGALRHVIVEVHNADTGGHAYLVPPTETGPAAVVKQFSASPFNEVDGYYLIDAPRPGATAQLSISWHRNQKLIFAARLDGRRVPATPASVARMQLIAPMAPLAGAVQGRLHGIALRLRGLPTVSTNPMPGLRKAAHL